MKKIVRTVCIGALSGLAFLAACCTTRGGLTKAERKQLIRERDSLQDILSRREGACVYGSPEVIASYSAETYRLRSQLDTINAKLGEEVNLETNARQAAFLQRKSDILRRIEELENIVRARESACVYGSPEIIQRYGEETRRLRDELEAARRELDELGTPGSQINDGKVEALYGVPMPEEGE